MYLRIMNVYYLKNRFKIIVPIIIVSLSLIGCESNLYNLSNKDVKATPEVKIHNLIKYKGSYIGDNSAVGNIIAKLPANKCSAGFSLQTNKQPYGIIINYKHNQSLGKEDYNKFWKGKKIDDFLEKNAVVVLSLIKNAECIEFKIDNIGEKKYKYDRKTLEAKYGGDLEKLFKDNASVEKFLNGE